MNEIERVKKELEQAQIVIKQLKDLVIWLSLTRREYMIKHGLEE